MKTSPESRHRWYYGRKGTSPESLPDRGFPGMFLFLNFCFYPKLISLFPVIEVHLL
jgi:hypothetical protein